jgi:hypothetical protein
MQATRATQLVRIETSVHLTGVLKQILCFYFYDARCTNNGHDGEMFCRIVID